MTKYQLIDNTDQDLESNGQGHRPTDSRVNRSDAEDESAQEHRPTVFSIATVGEDILFELKQNVSSINIFYMLSLATISGLLNPNLSLIAEEFHFTDRQRDIKLAAFLTLAFFLSGVPAAAGAGLLTDLHIDRRHVFLAQFAAVAYAACVLIWFLPPGPVSYIPLLFLRALCGAMVGAASATATARTVDRCEAGFLPISAAVSGVLSSLGVGAGQLLAGFSGSYKGWRYPSLIVGGAGLTVFAMHMVYVSTRPTSSQQGDTVAAVAADKATSSNAQDAKTRLKFWAENQVGTASPRKASTSGYSNNGTRNSDSNSNSSAHSLLGREKGSNHQPTTLSSSISSFLEAALAPEVRHRAFKLLCGTPTVFLLLVTILVTAVPSSAVDVFWTNHLTLQMFDEAEKRLHPDAWAGRDKRAKRLYTKHVNLRRDALFSLSTQRATLVMVAIQVGSAIGQMLGASLGVWYTYSSFATQPKRRPSITTLKKSLSSHKNAASGTRGATGRAGGGRKDEEEASPPALEPVKRQGLYAAMVLAGFLTPLPFLYLLGPAPPVHGHYIFPYVVLDFLGGVLRGINDPLCKSLVLGLTPQGMEGAAAGAFVLTSSLGRALGPSVVALSEVYHPSFKGIEGHGWREGRKAAFGSTFKLWFAACFLLAGLLCVGDRDAKHALEEEEGKAQLLGESKEKEDMEKRGQGKKEHGKEMNMPPKSPQPKEGVARTTGKAQSVLEQLQQEHEKRLVQQKRQHQQRQRDEEGVGIHRRKNPSGNHGVAYFVPWRNTTQQLSSAGGAAAVANKTSASCPDASAGETYSSSPPTRDQGQQHHHMTAIAREQLHQHFKNQKVVPIEQRASAAATSPNRTASVPFRPQLKSSPPPTRSNEISHGNDQSALSEHNNRVISGVTKSIEPNAMVDERGNTTEEASYIGRIVARKIMKSPQNP